MGQGQVQKEKEGLAAGQEPTPHTPLYCGVEPRCLNLNLAFQIVIKTSLLKWKDRNILSLLVRYVTFKDGMWASVCIPSLGPTNNRCETGVKNGQSNEKRP